ncbi:MAG: hypothetical protein AAFY29_12165 [Pseudomonadota bacterium]
MRVVGTVSICLGLIGCGGVSNYVADTQPRLVDPAAAGSPAEALENLITVEGQELAIEFCEAATATGDCLVTGERPSASGVGGLFLPLKMELRELRLTRYSAEDDSFAARLDAPVNAIPPACGEVDGRIERGKNGDALRVRIPNFYCNWAGIGNVLTTMTFAIRDISADRSYFTGYYKIEFYGTGNATGSGFFRASLRSNEQ